MRTTLEIPETLLQEAMMLTQITVETDLVVAALQNLIQREKAKELKRFFGKLDLELNMNELRSR